MRIQILEGRLAEKQRSLDKMLEKVSKLER